jgi:hypothetical protein
VEFEATIGTKPTARVVLTQSNYMKETTEVWIAFLICSFDDERTLQMQAKRLAPLFDLRPRDLRSSPHHLRRILPVKDHSNKFAAIISRASHTPSPVLVTHHLPCSNQGGAGNTRLPSKSFEKMYPLVLGDVIIEIIVAGIGKGFQAAAAGSHINQQQQQ